ncbi:MAG: translation initiation factor IF-2 [Oscillospiraceae bacterium]|nr:translation initiation factor IF-2 [Oscillospiraceae bacterium]
MINNKQKLSTIAKEFEVKSKELIAIFDQLGTKAKNPASHIEQDEFELVFTFLTEQYQMTGINDYLTGKTVIKIPRPAPPKVEEPQTPQVAEAQPEADVVVPDKPAEVEQPVAEPADKKKSVVTPPHTQKTREQAQADKMERFKKPVTTHVAPKQKKQQERTERPQNQILLGKKDDTPTTTTVIQEGSGSAARPGTRVIDTRGSGGSANLSKYDERFEKFASDGVRNYNPDKSVGTTRLKKQDNRNKRVSPAEKERQAMERLRKQEAERKKKPLPITLPEEIIVSDLAAKLRVTTAQVVKKLFTMGIKATLNENLDFDTAFLIADEFGAVATREVVVTIEDRLFDEIVDTDDQLVTRPPVVVVMGHVDHGKTSLLDAIRQTNVVTGEAGGITQHIGAYQVNINDRDITFLDTPGHAAFTSMRARGAKATDIAILVVAADDGIMPQTVEAINHARAAGVEIVVAINKIDKPSANIDAVKQGLSAHEIITEDWGGDTIAVPVSAHTKEGIDELLENILLLADVKELKANPDRRARGIVIEARLDKGRGPVATVLVQSGTLHAGDTVIAGTAVGRVRAMTDENGKALKTAGPSVPVELVGLAEVPAAGDEFNAVEDERMARELAEQRKTTLKEEAFRANSKVNLDDLFSQIKEGTKELGIILKADVGGSAEAVKASLEKLSVDEVKIRIIHTAVGGITESDVMLATASNAIIVGFNVRPDKKAIDLAERQGVDVRTYRIIYECIEEITLAIKGMLAPVFKEVVLGHAQVRQTISVPGVGVIAGSYVQDGIVKRNAMIRVVRDGVVIFEDSISSLRRFKDDVREVATNYECGIGLDRFNDIKEGDILEAYEMVEVER